MAALAVAPSIRGRMGFYRVLLAGWGRHVLLDFAPPPALVDGICRDLSLFYGPWRRARGSWPVILPTGEISPVSLDSGRLSDQLECSHRGSPK